MPNRLVNDYTNTLSADQAHRLEQKLVTFDDSTSTQIAVVILQSTGQYDIADYAVRLAQRWGIGSKEHNNGILLLVALGDRAVTIQTGYGVEATVPDAIAYRIIENEIKPAFRQGNYYEGIDRATDALISYTKGEYNTPRRKNRGSSNSLIIPSLVFLIFILVIIRALTNRGGGGGGGRVFGGRGASDIFWWALLNQMGQRNRGGGFGGGGFGGGFGGGGFGGFGGGSFGGGGASGRW